MPSTVEPGTAVVVHNHLRQASAHLSVVDHGRGATGKSRAWRLRAVRAQPPQQTKVGTGIVKRLAELRSFD
jgi:hypothetical protein